MGWARIRRVLDEVPSWEAVDLISRCVPRIYLCALVHVVCARSLVSVSSAFGVVPLPAWHHGRGSRGSTWNGLMWWDVLQRAGKLGSACHPGGDGESVARRALFSLFPPIPLHFPASFYNLFKSKNPSLYSLVRHGFVLHGSSSLTLSPWPRAFNMWSSECSCFCVCVCVCHVCVCVCER